MVRQRHAKDPPPQIGIRVTNASSVMISSSCPFSICVNAFANFEVKVALGRNVRSSKSPVTRIVVVQVTPSCRLPPYSTTGSRARLRTISLSAPGEAHDLPGKAGPTIALSSTVRAANSRRHFQSRS